ncbi:MAG: PEP-CTERM sorting domain-containing protein [Bryobacteraceae bacterium]
MWRLCNVRPAFALLLLASISAFGDTLYTISDPSTGGLIIQFAAPSSTAGDFNGLTISNYGAWDPYSTNLRLDTTTTVSYAAMSGWNTTGSVLTSGSLGMVEPWPAACFTNSPPDGCDSDGEPYDLDFQFFAAGYNGSPGDGEYNGVMGRVNLVDTAVTLSVVDPPSSVPEPATAGLMLAAIAGLWMLTRLKKRKMLA